MADKGRAGKTVEIKALLKQFGGDALSAIDPKAYSGLLAAVEAM